MYVTHLQIFLFWTFNILVSEQIFFPAYFLQPVSQFMRHVFTSWEPRSRAPRLLPPWLDVKRTKEGRNIFVNTYCRVASACRYRWGLSNAWDQFHQISSECTSISSENKTKFDNLVLPFYLYPPTLYIPNLHLLCNHWIPRGSFYFDPPLWFLRFRKLWKIHTCLFHTFHPAIKHRRVNLNWEEPIMNPMLWFFRSTKIES